MSGGGGAGREGEGGGGDLGLDLGADLKAPRPPGGCSMASPITLHIGRPRHMKCTAWALDGPSTRSSGSIRSRLFGPRDAGGRMMSGGRSSGMLHQQSLSGAQREHGHAPPFPKKQHPPPP